MKTPESISEQLLQKLGHVPTDDQYRLIKQLASFLTGQTEQGLFLMKGYAGTGKTTITGAMVKILPELGLKALLLAPTGRAAKVLSRYAGEWAFTIHKIIYRQEKGADGRDYFMLQQNPHKNAVFIIDESSMIAGYTHNDRSFGSSNLLEDLLTYIYSGFNCKAVFIGDTAQLPPVGSELSPAMDPKYLGSIIGSEVIAMELKEVVRQEKNSGILINATGIRELIRQEKQSNPCFITKGFTDIRSITGLELEEALNESYDQYGGEETIVICRSNKRANLFNQQIRARIKWLEEEIAAGDLMMAVKNNYFWLKGRSKTGFIANGDTMEILKVINREELYGFRFADVAVRLVDYPKEPELEVKILLDTIMAEAPALDYEQNKKLYQAVMEDYIHITNKGERYGKIKSDPYFNALQVKFSYAVTCHKSQGGQWESVFVDQGYLTEEMIDTGYLRWLYTALTRATKKLYLVNFNSRFFDDGQ